MQIKNVEENLIEGVNIGALPDIFKELRNYKIMKIKGSDDISSLNEDYRKLLEHVDNSKDYKRIEENSIVKGKIVKITNKEIIVDFNYKDYVYIDNKINDDIISQLKINDTIDVLIVNISDNPYIIKGSILDLMKMNVQDKIKQYFHDDLYFVGKIKESKPAGFMMDIDVDGIKIEGFMPNTLASANRLTNLQTQDLVGQSIEVMLETLQQDKGIYVVSRKKYLLIHMIPRMIEQLTNEYIEDKNKIKSGEISVPRVYKGYVTGTTPFGVFVEFMGCLTGMIYKYNINEIYQDIWHEIKPGLEIDFYVKEITKKQRIILTQILRDSLWDTLKTGKTIKGTVLDIKPFGVLVQIDEETNGLIQNAHLKSDIELKVGDIVEVKVVSIIKDDRKLYLSLNSKEKSKEKK